MLVLLIQLDDFLRETLKLNIPEYCYIDAIRETCTKPVPSRNSRWYNGHKRAKSAIVSDVAGSGGQTWERSL